MPLLSGKTFIGRPLSMYEDTTPTIISKCIMWLMLIGSKLKALKSLTNLFHCNFMSNMLVHPRGVFGQQFDPLVFERFSKFATKIAKMTGKE